MISIKRLCGISAPHRRLPVLAALPVLLVLLLSAPAAVSATRSAVAVDDAETQKLIEKLQEKLTELDDGSKTKSWKSLALVDDEAGVFKDLKKVDDSQITKEINWECGDSYSGSVSDLLKRYTLPEWSELKKPADYSAAQRKVCQHQVATRLSRGNLTVRLRERLVDHEKLLNEILKKTDVVQRNTDLAGFSAIVQTDLNYTQAALMAYDGRLTELAGQRSKLNEAALNGNDSHKSREFSELAVQVAGGTAVLAASLEAAKLLVDTIGL